MPLLQRHYHLEQPRYARRRLEVPEVGLAEPTAAARDASRPVPSAAPRACNSIGSPRMCQCRAPRRSRYRRRQARIGEGGGDDRLLGGAVRCCEATAAPILVDGRATNKRENAIPTPLRIGKPAQRNHAHPLPRP